ncbi:MAG: GatB/YqeY domain-containing protein [Candidatus Pacebacteria bacterium]|nr:GatB/YqeY domain-containing protein [Candidatus Paceibacterota bacterium]
MKIEEKIKEDLKAAMKGGDKFKVEVLRGINSNIKNEIISKQKTLEDGDVVAIVKKNIKSRKDSIEQFSKGGREDLAEKEKAEVAVLEEYMPEQMGESEVESIVKKVIAGMNDTEVKNFGLVMKAVMKEAEGKADGNLVSGIVKKTLIG